MVGGLLAVVLRAGPVVGAGVAGIAGAVLVLLLGVVVRAVATGLLAPRAPRLLPAEGAVVVATALCVATTLAVAEAAIACNDE